MKLKHGCDINMSVINFHFLWMFEPWYNGVGIWLDPFTTVNGAIEKLHAKKKGRSIEERVALALGLRGKKKGLMHKRAALAFLEYALEATAFRLRREIPNDDKPRLEKNKTMLSKLIDDLKGEMSSPSTSEE